MNVSSWIRVGKNSANQMERMHQTNLESTPDYVGLQVAAMNAKSSERQAAIAAEAKVRAAGMRALTDVKKTRVGIDAKEEINDMKLSNFRKAGIIGALGTVAAGGVAAAATVRRMRIIARAGRIISIIILVGTVIFFLL